jgi:transcriptional regulator with GAF, ATPase, and Fis domain
VEVINQAGVENNPPPTLDSTEKSMLVTALEMARNNVSKAARHLGVTRMKMSYRMEKHGINV